MLTCFSEILDTRNILYKLKFYKVLRDSQELNCTGDSSETASEDDLQLLPDDAPVLPLSDIVNCMLSYMINSIHHYIIEKLHTYINLKM